MKKLLLVAFMAVMGIAAAVAQPRAIGVNIGYGADVSYQHSLSEANMLDISLNLPSFSGIGAKVTYDWINPFGTAVPWEHKGTWNWYLGVGASGGLYELLSSKPNAWYVGAAGHVGIEYQFWFPLQLSLDYRPTIGVLGSSKVAFNPYGLYDGISLGVRYLF